MVHYIKLEDVYCYCDQQMEQTEHKQIEAYDAYHNVQTAIFNMEQLYQPKTDWILLEEGDYHTWGCKNCRAKLSSHWEAPKYKYCPECGAERIHKNEN